jgi:hypothetical protein
LQSISEDKRGEKEVIPQEQRQAQTPIYSFMYPSKSSEARKHYLKRLMMLSDFLALRDSLEEQASFLNKAREYPHL